MSSESSVELLGEWSESEVSPNEDWVDQITASLDEHGFHVVQSVPNSDTPEGLHQVAQIEVELSTKTREDLQDIIREADCSKPLQIIGAPDTQALQDSKEGSSVEASVAFITAQHGGSFTPAEKAEEQVQAL